MAQVAFKNVTKLFGEVIAVNDLTFSAKDGEFFSLLGPSGCGKTTILRMIAGFAFPTKGEIFFNDREVSSLPPNKRETGMVFQNYALFPHMTVFENVAFGLEVRNFSKDTVRAKVRYALGLVSLSGLEGRRISELSGGQQQRVALARAIVIEPQILLLDEPLSNLDARLREETRSQIHDLQRRLKITTIYVTHDQEEALTLSDTIAVMNQGVCQQIGSPEEIYTNPANRFVAQFMGRSNILEGEVETTHPQHLIVKTHLNSLSIPIFVTKDPSLSIKEGENVTLSIRPETIRLSKMKTSEVNSLEGRIESQQFNGYTVDYKVTVNGRTLNVVSLHSDESLAFRPNESVFVEFVSSKIKIFRE